MMQTGKAQNPDRNENEDMTPYVVTWIFTIGIFTLLLWVGVWLVQQ